MVFPIAALFVPVPARLFARPPMMLSRFFGTCVMILAFAITQALPASAGDETAKQFLERIYRPYIGSNREGLDYQSPAKSRLYFDTELNALYQKDRKESEGEVGRLDFDPFVEAQDFAIKSVRIVIEDEEAGHSKGIAAFNNGGKQTTVQYDLVRSPNGWRIANIIWPDEKDDLKSLLSKPFP